MEIKIHKDLGLVMDQNVLKKFGITPEEYTFNEYRTVNLREFDQKSIETLSKNIHRFVFEAGKIKSARTTYYDIQAWLKMIKKGTLDKVKAQTAERFFSLLKIHLASVPGHRVYQKDIDRNVTLCYFTSEIRYHPREKRRDGSIIPAHVSMQLFWKEFSIRHEGSETFWPQDFVGLSAGQALSKMGYMDETKELREAYLEEKERYDKAVTKVGRQYLGYGVATNDVDSKEDEEDEDEAKSYWYRKNMKDIILDKDDEPSRLVVDVYRETDKKDDGGRHADVDWYFWKAQKKTGKKEDDLDENIEHEEIPVHPYLVVFDLKKHMRLKVHIAQMAVYKYDDALGEKLVIPASHRRLVDVLLEHKAAFTDIVKGKGSSSVIICAGPPGTGKTLTSEVYAEVAKRPLYSIQCSQLGTDPDKLEDQLLKIFARAQRWKAILLLDEADVYVKHRGDDLVQNGIVGVFLRTLEYYKGVMFLTTNRDDLIDDAILSRCISILRYSVPTIKSQMKIWKILADNSNIKLDEKEIKKIVKEFDYLTGRDIKNILKLANMVALSEKKKVDIDLVRFAKKFKPTNDIKKPVEEKT